MSFFSASGSVYDEFRGRGSSGDGGASARADRAAEETRAMRSDMERALMICEALWTMLKEQHGYTDEDLFRRVMEIDLRDGRADGRVAPSAPASCPHCGHVVSKHRAVCLYCGKAMMVDPFSR